MSARPAGDAARDDAWFAARLDLLDRLNDDRALAPASRHTMLELLLDEIEDALDAADGEDDHHLAWSARLASRLGLTTRGVRKATAELAGLGLVEAARGDLRVLPARAAERLCRGTDLPRAAVAEDFDPLGAHAERLWRLRQRAEDEGLIATAVSAQQAIGRALGFYARKPRRGDYVPPDYAAMPPHERKGMLYDLVIPMLRDFFLLDPDHQEGLLAFFAEFRAASAAALGEEARAAGPPSPFETQPSAAPQDEGYFDGLIRSPHPEERAARLEG
ncbi:hypothetical protein [Desertibaculum subflavum]|uniref:hypothetical protein n=1 Tax=Desertibaculum subflavum TaxID=2268458 RepID=UPI000E674AAC